MVRTKTRRRKRAPPRAPKHRASWSGAIKFGLVTFPVEAFNAINPEAGTIHFHQLHAECGSRLHYEKVCPIHGAVSNDEIVSGYEYARNKYVEIKPEELEALATRGERALVIDTFIEPGQLDPIFYDGRMYYLVAKNEAARESYELFRLALKRQERFGVGQIVFSGRQQVVLVRPFAKVLLMAMLNYKAEVRDPDDFATSKENRPAAHALQLAERIIDTQAARDFDYARYEDHYRDKVFELIEAKRHGETIEAPAREVEPEVISLMDALKQSLARAHAGRRAPDGHANGRHHRRRRAK